MCARFRKSKRRKNAPIKREGSRGFKDGLNTLAHPSMLKNTELSELINGIYSQYGTISKRLGSVIIGSEADGASEILNMQATYSVDGEDRFIRISDNGKPEVYDFNAGDWDYLSDTEPAGYAGSEPAFTDGVPTLDTSVITWIVQHGNRIYFANENDDLVWLDDDGWGIYERLDSPTAKPTVAKTGSGTGQSKHYYQYVWYNEAGGTEASPPPDPDSDSEGTGWYGSLPEVLDEDTYLTVTLPSAPAGATRVGIYKSNRVGEAFFLTDIEASQTSFVDDGSYSMDFFAPFPEPTANESNNTTGGLHFKLLDAFEGRLVGVTTEYGSDALAWSGGFEDLHSFGLPNGAGFTYYRRGTGTSINAIKAHVASNESSLFVFKDDVFGKFEFLAVGEDIEGRVRDVNISVGSLSPFSPHVAGNNLRFWSRDGASTVGNEENYGTILRYSVLSLRAQSVTDRVTPANIHRVSGVFYKSLSLFGISTDVSGGGNNSILAYDERYNAWSLWTGLYPAVFAKVIHPTTKEEKLYYGSSKDAYVLEMFNGRTDYRTSSGSGTKITLSISTGQYDMGLPDQYKKFDRCVLVFGNLTGNNTTVGISREGVQGVVHDERLRIPQQSVQAGFSNDLWGEQLVGESTTSGEVDRSSIFYIPLRQQDLFWAKANIQNDGVSDEISLLGIYWYYSESNRPLPFNRKLTEAA